MPNEIVLVNDNSPDETAGILSSYVRELNNSSCSTRCVVIENERNIGQAASLNRAISSVGSDLVMVLNDDDYLLHDAVEVMAGLLDKRRDLVMLAAHSIHFSSNEELRGYPKLIKEWFDLSKLSLTVSLPEQVPGYRKYNDINMTHSGCSFFRFAWAEVGGYYTNQRRRVVPFSDRDFQLRVNALYPVATAYEFPVAFWRMNSSVDKLLNS